MTVFEEVQKYLNDKDLSVKLNGRTVNITRRVMEAFPDLFEQFDGRINQMMADKVLDQKDIPTAILLVTDVVNANSRVLKKLKLTRQDLVDVIEGVLFILIDVNVLQTSEETKELLLASLRTSIGLLEVSVDLKETIRCDCCC
jgi:hypothetical protein